MGLDRNHDFPCLPVAVPAMMNDHETLSAARNHLVDALKALLKAGIMGRDDFIASLNHASTAIDHLNVLLRQPHRN